MLITSGRLKTLLEPSPCDKKLCGKSTMIMCRDYMVACQAFNEYASSGNFNYTHIGVFKGPRCIDCKLEASDCIKTCQHMRA